LPSPLFFARTVHGLEGLAATELESLGCTIVSHGKRQLILRAPGDRDEQPRLLDDLFALLASTEDPGRTKAGLDRAVARLRPVENDEPYSITASFAGARNYNRYDIEDAVARIIGGRYRSRRGGVQPPPGTADFRVSLGLSGLLVGRRVADRPLHRRAWKVATIAGTLHPPVAAAMAQLADIKPGHRVIDPCCGAGTLLIEAAGLCPGAEFRGSDISVDALTAAAVNGPHLGWKQYDTTRLPDATGSVDRIIVNPPWGVRLPALRATAEREWHRVLRPGGILVCLIPGPPPRQADAGPPGGRVEAGLAGGRVEAGLAGGLFGAGLTGWRVEAAYPISLAGPHPWIVVARR
jgi:23S rRNA G2445 N2-methylase RlmL